jgi:long-chain acyl-CoA synthetase
MANASVTKVDPSKLPLQRLYHWESTKPNARYLTQPMGNGVIETWTWKEMMDESRRIATYLQTFGWPKGTRVALMSKNCAYWLMTDYAIWMAGYVSVPLYPTLAPDTVAHILKHSDSKLCFIGKLDDWELMRPGVPTDLPCVSYPLSPKTNYPTWNDLIAKHAPLAGNPVRDPDELATIIYTSGTTGMPKGVMHSFATFTWALQAANDRVGFRENDRMLSYLPLAHVAERAVVEFGSFTGGYEVFFAESLDTFVSDVQRARPTLFFSVPRLWVKFQQGVQKKMPAEKLNKLLKIPILRGIVKKKILTGLGLDQCRLAVGGAAPMPPSMLMWYDKLGLPITEGYGMTENCAVTHGTLVGKLRPGTVGQPYKGIEQRLEPVSNEIQIKSPGNMLGYYLEPELTKAAFTDDGWLKTGDKGSIDAEGNLKITGRVKDLFKTSKGKYVAPAPIEDRLVMHPLVEACCVVGANMGQPLGIVMLSPDGVKTVSEAGDLKAIEASFAEHLAQINQPLDPHEHMDALIVVKTPWTVESGFITPTMKIKRNKIEDAYSANYEKWAGARRKVIWFD